MRRLIAALFCLVALAGNARALDNGLALTPPMGWDSWNHFACHVSERDIRGITDSLVSSGMRDAGYQYVIVDDCWQGPRDAAGALTADPKSFPSGIKALADYVHSKGLKFGIYADAGDRTCAGRTGSRDHEQQDAKTFAAWGVDYVKYDWCTAQGSFPPDAYKAMGDALDESGRPMLFAICEWGVSRPWDWAPSVGNLWRTAGDIGDCFTCVGRPPGPWLAMPQLDFKGPPPSFVGRMGLGVLQVLQLQAGLGFAAGPGHWNDPDMLEVGNGGMTEEEDRTQFSMWAMLAAPLIAGNDLTGMTNATKAILTNREVIAVDQDRAGVEGERLRYTDDEEVWARPLADGARAVALLNRSDQARVISIDWQRLGLAAGAEKVRDLWRGHDLGSFAGSFSANVPPHGAALIRVVGGR